MRTRYHLYDLWILGLEVICFCWLLSKLQCLILSTHVFPVAGSSAHYTGKRDSMSICPGIQEQDLCLQRLNMVLSYVMLSLFLIGVFSSTFSLPDISCRRMSTGVFFWNISCSCQADVCVCDIYFNNTWYNHNAPIWSLSVEKYRTV